MSLFAACVFNQLLKYANDEGKIQYPGGDFVRFLGCTYGATAGDRRMLPGHLAELEQAGAIVLGPEVVTIPQYRGHRPPRKRFVADGTDLSHETFRLLYCVEQGSYATLSFYARGLLGELLRLVEDDGRLTYQGELGRYVANRLGEAGPRRRLVRKLVAELEDDGIFVREGEGRIFVRNFHKAHPAAARELEEAGGGRVVLLRPLPPPPDQPEPDGPAPVHEPNTNGARAGTENAGKPAELFSGDVAPSGPPPPLPGRSGDLFPVGADPYPAWFERMWGPWPKTNGTKPKKRMALRRARTACRQHHLRGEQLAELVLAALEWQRLTTQFQIGMVPHLANYLRDEGWLEERPTDPVAYLPPGTPSWDRQRVAQQQRIKRRQEREVEKAAAEPQEDPAQAEARRMRGLEENADRYTDWHDGTTWRKPYMDKLEPDAQAVMDRTIVRRVHEMVKAGWTPEEVMAKIRWARQYVEAHPEKRRRPAAPAVPDTQRGVKTAGADGSGPEVMVPSVFGDALVMVDDAVYAEGMPARIFVDRGPRKLAHSRPPLHAQGKAASS